MSIFDHKKNNKNGPRSKLQNTIGSLVNNFEEIAKEFMPQATNTNSQSGSAANATSNKPLEEIAKEYLPADSQARQIVNGVASKGANQAEIAKEFLPSKGQASISTGDSSQAAKASSNSGSANAASNKPLEEIAREFLPANSQASKIVNSVASKGSNKAEIAKEFLPTQAQTFKHDNGSSTASVGKQQPKSQEEIAQEFYPIKNQTNAKKK